MEGLAAARETKLMTEAALRHRDMQVWEEVWGGSVEGLAAARETKLMTEAALRHRDMRVWEKVWD